MVKKTMYTLDPALYLSDDVPQALFDKMTELAAAYIHDNNLSIEVDDLWNDGTAEQVREALAYGADHNEIFYAEDFFGWLYDQMNPRTGTRRACEKSERCME